MRAEKAMRMNQSGVGQASGGIFGHRRLTLTAPSRSISMHLVDGRGAERSYRPQHLARPAVAISGNAMPPSRKEATAISLAALRMAGAAPPASSASRARPSAGKRSRSGASKSSGRSRPDRAAEPASPSAPARPGHGRSACACPGAPSWASTEPSTYSTSEWITDWGWTRMSIALGRQAEQMVRLDQLEPLVHQGRRIDRDLGAHRPIGMGDRLRRASPRASARRISPERAAAGGQDQSVRRLIERLPASTGKSHYARCRPAAGSRRSFGAASVISAPAVTSASLLAARPSARLRPRPSPAQARHSRRSPPSPARHRPPRPGSAHRARSPRGNRVPRSAASSSGRPLRPRSPPAGAGPASGVGQARDIHAPPSARPLRNPPARSIRSSVDLPTEPVAPRIETFFTPALLPAPGP